MNCKPSISHSRTHPYCKQDNVSYKVRYHGIHLSKDITHSLFLYLYSLSIVSLYSNISVFTTSNHDSLVDKITFMTIYHYLISKYIGILRVGKLVHCSFILTAFRLLMLIMINGEQFNIYYIIVLLVTHYLFCIILLHMIV